MAIVTAWRQMVADFPNLPPQNLTGTQTLQVFQALSTTRLRLELNNEFSDQPLVISAIKVGAKTMIPVTWQHQTTVTVPAHGHCWTDWVTLPINAGDWLTITLQSPTKQPTTLSQTLGHTIMRGHPLNRQYFWGVDAIQVQRTKPTQTLMCFGDSLTNQGHYTGAFMQALTTAQPDHWGLINGGISGNRLLRDGHSTSKWEASFGQAGLQRLPKLLAQQSVDRLVVMIGLNDLLQPGVGTPLAELPTASTLIAGLTAVQRLARQSQTKLTLLTITPFKGAMVAQLPAWSPAKEACRQAVNAYLVTQPNTVDLASYVAAPNDAQQLAPAFDCGDATHFSAAGGQQIGQWLWQQVHELWQ